jgi:hypothetical protein
MNIKIIFQGPYSPGKVSAGHFLFLRAKAELSVFFVMQDTFQEVWDGVLKTIAKDVIVAAFRRWKEWRKKCIWIGGGFVEKHPEIKFFVKKLIFSIFHLCLVCFAPHLVHQKR